MPILRWDAGPVTLRTADEVERRMERAVIFLRDETKRLINRGNPTGKDPSMPGEPPKKVSTRLFQSISKAVVRTPAEIIGAYGTNVAYAIFLELGTSKMAPRPFIRPALHNNRARVLRFFQ